MREAENGLNPFGKEFKKLQGGDLNPRPPGYEPDELPGCSTLRQESFIILNHGRGGT